VSQLVLVFVIPVDPIHHSPEPAGRELTAGQWSVVSTPNPAGADGNAGFGVGASTASGETWAVGA
jgi:hypothetical protein